MALMVLFRLLSLSVLMPKVVGEEKRKRGWKWDDGMGGRGRRKVLQFPIPNGERDLSPLNGRVFPLLSAIMD